MRLRPRHAAPGALRAPRLRREHAVGGRPGSERPHQVTNEKEVNPDEALHCLRSMQSLKNLHGGTTGVLGLCFFAASNEKEQR